MAIFSQPGSCVLAIWRNVITMLAWWTCSEAGEQGQGHSRHSRCAAALHCNHVTRASDTNRTDPNCTHPLWQAAWPLCQSVQILTYTCMQTTKVPSPATTSRGESWHALSFRHTWHWNGTGVYTYQVMSFAPPSLGEADLPGKEPVPFAWVFLSFSLCY